MVEVRRGLSVVGFAALTMLCAHCVTPASSPGVSVSGLEGIRGQWDIVTFGDYQPARLDRDGQRHAFVDIAADGLSFTIGCNYSGASGRIDAVGRFITTDPNNVVTTMGCGAERERRDQVFFDFFRNQPRVARSGEDLVFETSHTRLVLQRPDVRRAGALAHSLAALDGDWHAPIIYFQGEPGANRSLIAWLDGAPASLTFGSGRARLRFDCEVLNARTSLGALGTLEFTDLERRASGACHVPKEDRDLAASLLSGAAEVEWIDSTHLHLVNGPVRAVLEPAQ